MLVFSSVGRSRNLFSNTITLLLVQIRHKLRSHHRIIDANKHPISQIREAGIRPAQVYDFFKQWYGGSENVPFSRVDCNNEIGRERKKYLPSNDTQTLLVYLKKKQLEDRGFFYAIEIDKLTGQIVNFFWVDGQTIMDYICFGDAVTFFKMPVSILVT
jgi:hypothetical protein